MRSLRVISHDEATTLELLTTTISHTTQTRHQHHQHKHCTRMEGFATLRATVQATMETHCPEVSLFRPFPPLPPSLSLSLPLLAVPPLGLCEALVSGLM